MRTFQKVVVAGSLLFSGVTFAAPPQPLTQEEAREAASRQHSAPYVDLAACTAAGWKDYDRTQRTAMLELAAPDRGPAIASGACRVSRPRVANATIDSRFRR